MNPTRIRLWMRKNGNLGLLAVACLIGGHYLWTKRRPQLIAFALVLCVIGGTLRFRHSQSVTHSVMPSKSPMPATKRPTASTAQPTVQVHESLPRPVGMPSHLPDSASTIPSSVLRTVQNVRPGMTREQLDILFMHYDGSVTSDQGIINPYPYFTVSCRTNPQVFYYRFAYVPPRGFGEPDTTHWQTKQDSSAYGTLIVVDVTWRYSNHRNRSEYRRFREGDRWLTTASVYDGVAGGSPDDVIVHVSKPYLTFDGGCHG